MMAPRIFSLLVLVLSAALVGAAPAVASCIALTPEEQTERAEVIFAGVALEGPTASGRQRFEVRRYLKGDGSDVVQVATGVTRRADGTGSLTSVSVDVARGDAWRIYGERISDGAIETSNCAGSRRIALGELPAATPRIEGSDRSEVVVAATLVAAVAAIGAAALFRRHGRRGA